MKKNIHSLVKYVLGLLLAFLGMAFVPLDYSKKVAFNTTVQDTLPIPPHSDKLLFYVQRTTNHNTIMYEMNIEKDGNLNKEEPVHAYWIRYTEKGEKAELSYMQRKFAYGIQSHLVDEHKQAYAINFVSYAKKKIQLQRSPRDKRYHAYFQLEHKTIELSHIYVRIEGGSFWVPNVPYIDIYGRDVATGHQVKERIKP